MLIPMGTSLFPVGIAGNHWEWILKFGCPILSSHSLGIPGNWWGRVKTSKILSYCDKADLEIDYITLSKAKMRNTTANSTQL